MLSTAERLPIFFEFQKYIFRESRIFIDAKILAFVEIILLRYFRWFISLKMMSWVKKKNLLTASGLKDMNNFVEDGILKDLSCFIKFSLSNI